MRYRSQNCTNDACMQQKLQWSSQVNIRRCTTGRTHENTKGTGWILGRKHTSQCEEKKDRGCEGEGRQRAGREDWVRVHLVRVFLKSEGSVSERATGSRTKAHGGDRLLGEFHHAPSAWGLQACVHPLVTRRTVFTPPIPSNDNLITFSHPVLSNTPLKSHYTVIISAPRMRLVFTPSPFSSPIFLHIFLCWSFHRWEELPDGQPSSQADGGHVASVWHGRCL